MNEKDEEELKQIIINCPDFETCPRIDDLVDRDITDWQLRDGVLKVCRRCLEEKGVIDGKSGAIRYWKGITAQSLVPKGQENVPNSSINGTRQTEIPVKSPIKEKQKDFIGNSVQVVPNVPKSGELPDCPDCGRNEWTYSPDGELLCPCGHKQGGS